MAVKIKHDSNISTPLAEHST